MTDFEKMWLEKLAGVLEKVKGAGFKDDVMKSAGDLSGASPPEMVVSWTAEMTGKLKNSLSPEEIHEVFTGCSCHYPPERLHPIRNAFRKNRSFPEALEMLREQFTAALRDGMLLEDEVIDDLLSEGMGPAGILEENRILATKIPKSGYLRAWLAEEDPQKRREIYCHCPIIRRAVEFGIDVPVEYCLCGAGFYRNIWETITEEPVRVEVIESIQTGDQFCRIAVYPSAMKA